MTAWRLMRHADYPVGRWRNDRGAIRSIVDGDGWQVRLADIEQSCPFSDYSGTQRLFAIADGAVVLRFSSGQSIACDAATNPAVFDGGPAPDCELVSKAPAKAFNLILLEPERVTGTIERHRIETTLTLSDGDGRIAAILVQQGQVAAGEIVATVFDALVPAFERAGGNAGIELSVAAGAPAIVLVARATRRGPQ